MRSYAPWMLVLSSGALSTISCGPVPAIALAVLAGGNGPTSTANVDSPNVDSPNGAPAHSAVIDPRPRLVGLYASGPSGPGQRTLFLDGRGSYLIRDWCPSLERGPASPVYGVYGVDEHGQVELRLDRGVGGALAVLTEDDGALADPEGQTWRPAHVDESNTALLVIDKTPRSGLGLELDGAKP